jgi:hypothetical protein
MNLVVPCYRNAVMPSYKALVEYCVPELPQWIDGLIKFQYFLHFMQGEMV